MTVKILRRVFIVAPLLILQCLLFVSSASAEALEQKPASATVEVTQATLQLPIPGTHNSAVFLRLTNTGTEPVTLVGVNTPVAAKAQLHSHTNVDGMMRMRPVTSLTIAPGAVQVLESGGYHIMLFEVQSSIASGEHVTLTLEFEGGATKSVQALVASRYDGADHSHHH